MDNKYWRVTLEDKITKVDVSAEKVNIDRHNNLYFTIVGEPVVAFMKGEWRAFTQIDKICGEPMWTKLMAQRESHFVYNNDGLAIGKVVVD